jgi:hypothetical protein
LRDRAEILDVINNLEERRHNRERNRINRDIDLHRRNTANAVGALDSNWVIEQYRRIQASAHQAANAVRAELRDLGFSDVEIEQDPRIIAFSNDWWNAFDSINAEMTNIYDRWITDRRNIVTGMERNNTDQREIISFWRETLLGIEAEIARFDGLMDEYSRQRVISLQNDAHEARQIIATTMDNIVRDATAALDQITGLYNNLLNAAQEFADSGFITIDQFKSIIAHGVEYLHLLQDENGQLVINERNIQSLIAARTEQVAVETALNYVYNIQQALRENEIETLNSLIYGTQFATNTTWDYVYANLELARVMGLTDDAYARASTNLNNLRSLQESAISGIGKVSGSIRDDLKEQERGLNDLLGYVMDMIKWETNQSIDGIRNQIRAFEELIGLRKQELREMQRKADFEKNMARQTRDLARLQAELAKLNIFWLFNVNPIVQGCAA